MTIKNIIFDLGGVIINLSYKKTLEAFQQLGATHVEEIYNQNNQSSLFDSFDIGKISEAEFRSHVKNILDIHVSDTDFDFAWNAMLLDLPIQRLEFIKRLRQNYKVYLFSNTNDIHLREVFNICQREHGFNNFNDYFDKQYYSNLFGIRKPNPDAFLQILSENNLNANETLFIDDSIQHVLGARQAGLHAIHLSGNLSIYSVLDYIDELSKQAERDGLNKSVKYNYL